jgi:hypothetical protein
MPTTKASVRVKRQKAAHLRGLFEYLGNIERCRGSALFELFAQQPLL